MSDLVKKEDVRNSLITVYNMIVGFLPYGHIAQAMFEHKSRIQKERLDKFSEFLKVGFEQTTGKEFNPDNLYNEDFLDTFEIIMRKVVMTKSELKLKQYRNAMLKSMFESNFHDDMFLKYVSLIEETNEIQILILNNFSQHSKQNILNVMNFLIPDGLRNPVKSIFPQNYLLTNGQTITFEQLHFFLLDLSSMGLLMRESQFQGISRNENFTISPIGEGFLKFINEYGSEN